MSFLSGLSDFGAKTSLVDRATNNKYDPMYDNFGSGKSGAQNAASSSSDPTKSGSASDRMGQLMRAEWDDYVKRFSPYDQKLIGLATSNEDNLAAIDRARSGVAGSFDVSQGTLQRNNERLGLSNAGDVTASLNRQTGANKTLAELSAVNNTRLHAQDRDQSIMAGDAAVGLKSGRLGGN